jgi:predicted ribonuclease YlaK
MVFFDTCALIEMADELHKEEYRPFVISRVTLQELEKIKNAKDKSEELKIKVRKLIRALYHNEDQFIVVPHSRKFSLDNDEAIINDAFAYAADHRDTFFRFFTYDLNCYFLAKEHFTKLDNIIADYRERPLAKKDDYTGFKAFAPMNAEAENELYEYVLKNINFANLLENEYLIINSICKECEDDEHKVTDLFKWKDGMYHKVPFRSVESMHFGIFKPRNVHQYLALDSMFTNRVTVVGGPAGSGKAQPDSTLIPTPSGTKRLDELQVGDYVYDRMGKPTKILNIYPQGELDVYEVTFSDGRKSLCNDEHLWTYYTSKGNFKTVTLREMLDKGLQSKCGDFRYKIPVNQTIEYDEKKFDIDPYVMGCFLGDGCCKEIPLTISSNDEELVKEIAKLIYAKSYKRNSNNNYSWTFYLSNSEHYKNNSNAEILRFQTKDFFKNYLHNVGVYSYEKSIPEEYKRGSVEQRFSLLQGLLDTDGAIDNAEKGRVRFFSCSKKLIEDVQEVCWSLGLTTGIYQDKRTTKYTLGECYELSIQCEPLVKAKLFRLSRKKNIALQYIKNTEGKNKFHYNTLTIKDIKKLDRKESMRCIYVDNNEHLYLTEDYIVTHNTQMSLAYLFNQLENGKIDRIVIFCNPVAAKNAAKLGYYPGSTNEKLLSSQVGNILTSKIGDLSEVNRLIDSGQLVLIPAADLRGYETPAHSGVYIMEGQNYDTVLMRMLLQRIGNDCQVIIDGDREEQTDLDIYENDNGMKKVSQVFRGEKIFGQVDLQKIERDEIARIAERMK